jgi:hypothetical protein
MRLLFIALLVTSVQLVAETSDEKEAIAVVQKTFDGMAAHDSAMILSTMLPDARLYSVREDGVAGASTAAGDFASQIASIKGDLLERFTDQPSVLIHGRMAQVWGDYEFFRDGKFGHCGVDSASLFKTAEGWKIATIVYTVEKAGCKAPHPLI